MRHIKYIMLHCSAGFGNWESIGRYWKEVNGWKSPGYHRFIQTDGYVHHFADYNSVVNGAQGYNNNSIHICYQGGVDPNNVKIAKDTRNEYQKWLIEVEIYEALLFLKEYQDISKVKILGHRDISPDKNLNGIIDPWERIKECPSFEVGNQYDKIIQLALEKNDK